MYLWICYKASSCFVAVNSRTILFCSFQGRSYSDNPRALFEYMVSNPKFADYTLVWGFRNDIDGYQKKLECCLKKFPADSRPLVKAVEYNGKEWRKYLASAKYWIFNYKVEEYLWPKKNQFFLQTWHGTPLKRLGFDLEHFDNVFNTKEDMKRRYRIEVQKFSCFLSPSPFATEKFKSAWRMDEFGKNNIILEQGYPRNDMLVNFSQKYVEEVREKILGSAFRRDRPAFSGQTVSLKKKVILYAPTYRSDQHESSHGYSYQMVFNPEKMQKELGSDFIILFRAHYMVASQFEFEKYKGFIFDVSGLDDINELYLISDLLVTDYSSSMFDYAVLKRPMIFYMYDLEHYRDESNGFYFDPESELPGPIVRTEDALIRAITELTENFSYDEKYRDFNEKFDPYEDGKVCERVLREIKLL